MAKSEYYIQRETYFDTVTIEKGSFSSKIKLLFNKEFIAELESENELKELKVFDLPTGEKLNIKKVNVAFLISELKIDVDGFVISQTIEKAEKEFKYIFNLMLIIIGLSLGLGLISEIFQIQFLLSLGVGIDSAIVGLIYLGLGLWFKVKKSKIALAIFLSLHVLDFLYFIVESIQNGHNPTSGIFIRGYITYALYRGFVVINRIKQKKN